MIGVNPRPSASLVPLMLQRRIGRASTRNMLVAVVAAVFVFGSSGCAATDETMRAEGSPRAAVLAFLDGLTTNLEASCQLLSSDEAEALRLFVISGFEAPHLSRARKDALRHQIAQRARHCTYTLPLLAKQLGPALARYRHAAATLPIRHQPESPLWTLGANEDWTVVDHDGRWQIIGWNRLVTYPYPTT